MHIEVCEHAFNPWERLATFESEHGPRQGSFGATATFVGTMRDFNEGDDVVSLTLEHYPGMTERQLERIVSGVDDCDGLLDVLVLHRVGLVVPGDPIVLVAVWSAHRAAAFSACRQIMEALKSSAPFWKKEELKDGQRWVAQNTPG
jgi:molybdopterin synthase catalytic subunit